MRSVRELLRHELNRCFQKAFTFKFEPIVKRSILDENYDYVCELPEQVLETFKQEMLQWGPSHLLFAKDIGEEILVHLDKNLLQTQGKNIIDRILLNDRGHIEIYLSVDILEHAVNQHDLYFQKNSLENTIVIGPIISLGQDLTLTQFRSLCIAKTISKQQESQHCIPFYQKNLHFCQQLHESLYQGEQKNITKTSNNDSISEKLKDFRDYLKLQDKNYFEIELNIKKLILRQLNMTSQFDTRVVSNYDDLLKQYDSYQRIIIVDEFKKIKMLKEDHRITLWGHNSFGEEFKNFKESLKYSNIESNLKEIKLQALNLESKRPHAYSDDNIQNNRKFLGQVYDSIENSYQSQNHQFVIQDQTDKMVSRMIIQYPEVRQECLEARCFQPLITYWQRLASFRSNNIGLKRVISRFHTEHLKMFNL